MNNLFRHLRKKTKFRLIWWRNYFQKYLWNTIRIGKWKAWNRFWMNVLWCKKFVEALEKKALGKLNCCLKNLGLWPKLTLIMHSKVGLLFKARPERNHSFSLLILFGFSILGTVLKQSFWSSHWGQRKMIFLWPQCVFVSMKSLDGHTKKNIGA